MNINLTLLGEMITFGILVVFTMKYVWPPIMKAMHDRQKKIADGLAAGERGEKSLGLAQNNIKKQLKNAKIEANNIIDQANKRVNRMLEEAKEKANVEGRKILSRAQTDIGREMESAKEQLRKDFAIIALQIAEKILQEKIDEKSNTKLIEQALTEICHGE